MNRGLLILSVSALLLCAIGTSGRDAIRVVADRVTAALMAYHTREAREAARRPRPISELSFILDNDRQKAWSKTCYFHHVPTNLDTVPIKYGLLLFGPQGEAYRLAAHSMFPNTWHWVAGGCTIEQDSPAMTIIRFCPACRAQERRWRDSSAAAPH